MWCKSLRCYQKECIFEAEESQRFMLESARAVGLVAAATGSLA